MLMVNHPWHKLENAKRIILCQTWEQNTSWSVGLSKHIFFENPSIWCPVLYKMLDFWMSTVISVFITKILMSYIWIQAWTQKAFPERFVNLTRQRRSTCRIACFLLSTAKSYICTQDFSQSDRAAKPLLGKRPRLTVWLQWLKHQISCSSTGLPQTACQWKDIYSLPLDIIHAQGWP